MSHARKTAKRKRQTLYVLFSIVILLVLAVYGWKQVSNSKYASVYFVGPLGEKSDRFLLDVANSPELTEKGLMFVTELADDGGMIFVFPTTEIHTFWMKNTYISLDMIFVSEALEVVGIVHEAPKMTSDARRVDSASRYVIELQGGVAKKIGISSGWKVVFSNGTPISG